MIRLCRFPLIATTLASLLVSPLCFAIDLPIPVSAVKRDAPVDFAKEIMPLLKRNCVACHHEKESEGGLNLESHSSLMKGGDTGETVTAKDAAASLLLTRATGAEEPLMPPEDNSVGAKPLTPEELGLIKLWIEQGASGSDSMEARVIEFQPIPESIRTIYAMDISPDGRLVATGRGNRVGVFDLSTKQQLGSLVDPTLSSSGQGEVADVDLIQSIAFAPDGQTIATGGFRSVKIWAKGSAERSLAQSPLAGASGLVSATEDRSLFALVNAIGDIELRGNDNSLKQTIAVGSDPVCGLAVTNDALCYCDSQGRVVVHRVADGSELATLDVQSPLVDLVTTGDARFIAVRTADRKVLTLRLDAAKPSLAAATLEALKAVADATAITATAKPTPTLAVASESQGVLLIDATSGKLLRKVNHGSPVDAVAFANDGSKLATGGRDGKTKTWNVADAKPLVTLEGQPRTRVLLARAQSDADRQKSAVDRLNKQTESLEKTLTAETEALKKVTEERDKAVEALAAEEKKRNDAAAKVTGTEAAIAKAKSDSAAANTMLDSANKTLASANATSDKLKAEVKPLADQLAKAKEAAEKAKQQVEAANKAMQQAQAEVDKFAKEVATREMQIAKAAESAAKAKAEMDAANKAIAAAKAATDKSTKQLEADKKALTAADEAKKKSETNVAKRKQAFDTATLAHNRAEQAIPDHKTRIAAETRRHTSLETRLSNLKQQFTSAPVTAVTFDSGSQLATADGDGNVTLYRNDGLPIESFESTGAITRVLFNSDQVTAIGSARQPQSWTLNAPWQLVRSIGSPNDSLISDRVTALDFRPDGLAIAVGSGPPSRSGEVQIFSTMTGQLVRDFGAVHSDTVLGIKFSPDGRRLASSAADKTVRLLDITTGKASRSLEGHTHHVLSLAWQDDGQTIASASADQNIKVWNIATGEQRRTIGGFPKEITAIRFVTKTNQVLTSCADGYVRLHDTGNGKSLRSFNSSGDFLFALSLTPDGKTLVAGGQSGVVRVWNVADGKLLHEWK